MDLFAKAVKSGIAKGYAIGQQQLQQHLAKQRDPGYDNTSDYGAPSSGGNTNSYSPFPQQQQQQQQYPATYNAAPPPLPPRQYQTPQPQPNYASQPPSQNSPVNYESAAPSRPEYSYSSIMPPPPPSYIPPTASTGATYSQYTAPPDVQQLGTSASRAYENKRTEIAQLQQPLHEVTAGFRPVEGPPAPAAEGFHGQQPTERLYARENGDGYYLGNVAGQGDLAGQGNLSQIQQPGESSSSYAVRPVEDLRQPQQQLHARENGDGYYLGNVAGQGNIACQSNVAGQGHLLQNQQPVELPSYAACPAEDLQQPQQRLHARENGDGYYLGHVTVHDHLSHNPQFGESASYAAPPATATYEAQGQPITAYEYATHTAPPAIETQPTEMPRDRIDQNEKPNTATSSVEQQMSNLSLSAASHVPEADPRSRQTKKRTDLPPILEDGPGREVVRFCPQHRLVDYPLYWHYLAGLPDSPICTRCYADHIESTPLAGHFERKLAEPETVLSCHFRYARVQNILWPGALKTQSLESLKAFLSSRLLVPHCKGRATTSGSDGVKYFGMKNDDINGFIACEACFEDHIVGTAFESQFEPYKHEQKENRWTCDASIQYVPKALAHFSKRNDWRGFVEGASRRFKAPACEGKETSRVDSGNWYTTRRRMDGFQVCEACYMDKVELDPFGAEYEQIPGSANIDEYIEFLRQRWTCSLPSSALPMMFALEVAETNEDFGAFYDSASAIVKLVPCTKHGIIRGNWWTVTGGCDNFDLCEACHEGIMKPYGLDRFLEPKQRGPEETVICDFCIDAPRFQEYFAKFVETLDRGIFSCYADHIRTFSGVQACPGRQSVAKAKWWGYGEALFCEHCYLMFVRHTALSAHMPLQGAYDERAQICQVWSPRMRAMWRAACDAGAPGSAASDEELIKFRAFGTKRLEVWLQTVPRITFIRTMKDMKMMQAMQQGQLSLMYKGMNSMAVLSGTDDGNLHGNSSIGWYETENGATGAQMFNNMQTGMADANRGDEWMQIFRLELIWKEVE